MLIVSLSYRFFTKKTRNGNISLLALIFMLKPDSNFYGIIYTKPLSYFFSYSNYLTHDYVNSFLGANGL